MLSRVRVVPAELKHVNRIARNMREMDAMECEAMGRTPKQALRLALFTSEKAWTALVDGTPEAMFGVVVDNAITGDATPWFLGTDEVYRQGRALLIWGKGFIAAMGDSRHLANFVSAKNGRAIRLLKRWGFTVTDEATMVRGEPFYHFEKGVR